MKRKSVKLYTDKVLETFYDMLLRGNVDNLHIPCEAHFGEKFTLERIENAMIAEGWKERSYSDPNYQDKTKSKVKSK